MSTVSNVSITSDCVQFVSLKSRFYTCINIYAGLGIPMLLTDKLSEDPELLVTCSLPHNINSNEDCQIRRFRDPNNTRERNFKLSLVVSLNLAGDA